MVNMTRRAWLLLSLYIVFILGVGGYTLFYRLGYAELVSLTEEVRKVNTLLANVEMMLANQDKVEAEHARVQKKLHTTTRGQSVTTDILQDIKSKAQEAGLTVVNIKPFDLKQKVSGAYATFDLKLEIEGELTNLGEFLYHLEESPYLFGIKHTQINAQSQGRPLKVQLLLGALVTRG